MKHLSIAACVAVLASAGASQADEQPAPTDAWAPFLRDHPGDWHVVWSKATETPKAIWGPGLHVAAGPADDLPEARRRAHRVLDEHADLLGVGESALVETIGQKAGNVWVFVFDQQFAGLDVIGGRADVRVHETGGISLFGSQLVQLPADFGTTPKVAAGAAEATALAQLGVAPVARPAPHLVIWADVDAATPTAARLAWEVQVDARPAQLVVAKVWVDAENGRVLEELDEIYYCGLGHAHAPGAGPELRDASARRALAASVRARRDAPFLDVTGTVMGFVRTGESATSAGVNTPIPNVLVSIDGGASAYTDASGNFSIPATGTNAVTVRVNFSAGRSRHANGGVSTVQGASTQATASAVPGGAPVTLQLAATLSQFELAQTTAYWHVDDVNLWVRGIVGNTAQLSTASNVRTTVNINDTCNAFYSQNSINFFAAGGSCNNTAFKTIVYHEWGHGLDERYGGISQNDGLSEGWGDILANYRADTPVVGLGFSTNGYVRDARNSRTYPVASSSVHTQGETWMGFAWSVRENLEASLGTAAGIAVAEAIVVGSIVADATNQPDAVREVFVLDDNDANLNNGVPHYAELSTAAIARNLPFPELKLGTLTHAPLANTTEQLKPRFVRLTATPNVGAFTGATLVYDAGAGIRTRSMVQQGGQWVALLPGVLSPQSVRYRFEVAHTTGNTLRLPESGEFRYAVGVETVLFSDNLDAGAPGWTHGMLANQDDWQLGRPAGKSGDPNGAFSGTGAWGNDLGPSGWDGRYRNNTHNYLRTPQIDCRGQTGVTLRFKRWLLVESGQYDQAQIRANGVIEWSNPSQTDLVDTSWTDVTVPVPQADNSLATLEWRLISDPGLAFGGWTIDDVEVVAFQSVPLPPVQFRVDPAQIPLGGSTTLSAQGTPSAPAALLISVTPGPLPVPVIPGLILEVGAPFLSIPLALDAAGAFQAVAPGFSAPGTVLYAQVLELSGGTVKGSNGSILFGGN